MTRKHLLFSFAFVASGFMFAQKKDVAFTEGGIKSAVQKIQNTVPLVVNHLQNVSKASSDPNILSGGKMLLKKEYDHVAKEFELFKGNMVTCISDNNSSKKMKKCMTYNSNYFRHTLINYDNYLKHVTKENGFLNVGFSKEKDFNPAEIMAKVDQEFVATANSIKKMKGDAKRNYIQDLSSGANSLQSFDQLAQ